MAARPGRRLPGQGRPRAAVDGSYHTVDSSEMAFKMAGSIAMKEAMAQAGAGLLEPIMLVTLSRPRGRRSATSSATSTRAAGARTAWSRRAA